MKTYCITFLIFYSSKSLYKIWNQEIKRINMAVIITVVKRQIKDHFFWEVDWSWRQEYFIFYLIAFCKFWVIEPYLCITGPQSLDQGTWEQMCFRVKNCFISHNLSVGSGIVPHNHSTHGVQVITSLTWV